jgi:hypothetical protein
MWRDRTEQRWSAHFHAAIALLAALASLTPCGVEAQGHDDAPDDAFTVHEGEGVDVRTLPSGDDGAERDFGYRRAARLDRIGGALTTSGAVGVAGAVFFRGTSIGLWVAVAAAVVGIHGLILFAVAAALRAGAADRARAADERVRVGLDVRVSPNEAGLVLSGSF